MFKESADNAAAAATNAAAEAVRASTQATAAASANAAADACRATQVKNCLRAVLGFVWNGGDSIQGNIDKYVCKLIADKLPETDGFDWDFDVDVEENLSQYEYVIAEALLEEKGGSAMAKALVKDKKGRNAVVEALVADKEGRSAMVQALGKTEEGAQRYGRTPR